MDSSNFYGMLLIILSSLEGFYSPRTIDFFGLSSVPSTSIEETIPPHIKQRRDNCKSELSSVFPEGKSSEEYIRYAIKFLSLSFPLSNFVEKYFKTFYPYIVQVRIPSVELLCTSQRGLEKSLCYDPIIRFFFNEPRGLLYNVVYNINRDIAKATSNTYIQIYLESVIGGLRINLNPENVIPFQRPSQFCDSVNEIPPNNPPIDPPNDQSGDNELEMDLELRLGH